VALNLKTCCTLTDKKILSSEEFLVCKSSAEQYQQKIKGIAANIEQAETAKKQGNTEVVSEKVEQASVLINQSKINVREIDNKVTPTRNINIKPPLKPEKSLLNNTIKPSEKVEPDNSILGAQKTGTGIVSKEEKISDNNRLTPLRDSKKIAPQYLENTRRSIISNTSGETESNNTISEAQKIGLGISLTGEISENGDNDYFVFSHTGDKLDKIDIQIENLSTTFRPALSIYNQKKSRIFDDTETTRSANLGTQITVKPNSDYYIQVAGISGSKRPYRVVISKPKQSYDRYESNIEY
jgi:hypothetical protein